MKQILAYCFIIFLFVPNLLFAGDKDFKIVGYLPEYRMATVDTSIGKYLSHLIYFNLRIDSTGGLDWGVISEAGIEKVMSIKERYNIPVQICVAGWWTTYGKAFAPVMTNDSLRGVFVQNVLDFCLEYGFDGVDYDWEHPQNEEEIEAYADLFEETKTAFEPYDMILSAAVSRHTFFPSRAYEALDKIHIMAYGSIANLSYDSALDVVSGYLERDIPREKIFLGTPFYGRDEEKAHAYFDIVDKYDPGPELNHIDGITYQGIYTTERRALYARKENLGGIMIWEIGQDSKDEKSLLKALYNTKQEMDKIQSPVSVSAIGDNEKNQIRVKFAPVPEAIGYQISSGMRINALLDTVFSENTEIIYSDCMQDSLYYFSVVPIGARGERGIGTKLVAASFGSADQTVLIVNDYDPWRKPSDLIKYHASLFHAQGYQISSTFGDNLLDSPHLLQQYQIIDWLAGDKGHYCPAITNANIEYLSSYLDQGGDLFISGSNIGYDLYHKGSIEDKVFFVGYLNSIYKADVPGMEISRVYSLEVPAGSFLGMLGEIFFDDGNEGTYNVFNPDVIYPWTNGTTGLIYPGLSAGANAACIFNSGLYGDGMNPGHMVYFTIPFETIYPEKTRRRIFERILAFFNDATPIAREKMNSPLGETIRSYPNPFNSSTTLEINISTQSGIDLKIYNILGEIIAEYFETGLLPGKYYFHWEATHQPSGYYFYTLSTRSNIFKGKLLYIK